MLMLGLGATGAYRDYGVASDRREHVGGVVKLCAQLRLKRYKESSFNKANAMQDV